ncbi:hypothetical protein CHS0354_018424 [Potamilus streckersoni]|uniref:Uncharacterized protein n=1 Tax=Potamilus streckersoni TaxID=2493646 RepID=A0AAE0TAJ0_9BIVA|nr:hypothetical protein CHS0354_018424 [Potamilus streckersoni]
MKITGKCFVDVPGIGRLVTKTGTVEFTSGSVKREAVIGDSGVVGYKETDVAVELKFTVFHGADTTLRNFDIVDKSITLETDTGKKVSVQRVFFHRAAEHQRGQSTGNMIYELKTPVSYHGDLVAEIEIFPLSAGDVLRARRKAEQVFLVKSPSGDVPVVADSRHIMAEEILKSQCSALKIRPLPEEILYALSEEDFREVERLTDELISVQQEKTSRKSKDPIEKRFFRRYEYPFPEAHFLSQIQVNPYVARALKIREYHLHM